MCTVTFIPKRNNNFILTTNRDEAPSRKSLPPDFYDVDGVRALFPKDRVSGGTWIGISDKSRLICILNGGSIRHVRKSHYRKSRGLVAKEFLACDSVSALIKNYDFSGIEPFTMILVEWSEGLNLVEFILNEDHHECHQLPLVPKIWSSTTLYTESMIRERQKWFDHFVSQHQLNAEGLLNFHKNSGKGNLDFGVVMDRGFVKTTSRTQVEKMFEVVDMRYKNLLKDTKTDQSFHFPQCINE